MANRDLNFQQTLRWSHFFEGLPGYNSAAGTTRKYSVNVASILATGQNPYYVDDIVNRRNASRAYERQFSVLESGPEYNVIFGLPCSTNQVGMLWGGGYSSLVLPSSNSYFDGDLGTDLLNKYRKLASKFKTLTFISENARDFKHTVNGIGHLTEKYLVDTGKKLARHERIIRGHRPRASYAVDLLEDMSQGWLSYSFGVKPLMSDAEKLAQAIAASNISEEYHSNVVIVASAENTVKTYDSKYRTWATSALGGFNAIYADRRVEKRQSVKYIYGLNPHCSVDVIDTTRHFFDTSSSGINDVVVTAWELVPYSWIVDYFTTAGDFLDSATAGSIRGNLVYGVKCQKTVETVEMVPWVSWATTNKSWDIIVRPQVLKRTAFKRSIVTSFPVSELRFRSLREIAETGNPWSRIANLSACIGGRGKLLSRLVAKLF